jgi:hypothetical protein
MAIAKISQGLRKRLWKPDMRGEVVLFLGGSPFVGRNRTAISISGRCGRSISFEARRRKPEGVARVVGTLVHEGENRGGRGKPGPGVENPARLF